MGDRETGGKRFSGSEKSSSFLELAGEVAFACGELRIIQSGDSGGGRQCHRNDAFLFERQSIPLDAISSGEKNSGDGYCFCSYAVNGFCDERPPTSMPQEHRQNVENLKAQGYSLLIAEHRIDWLMEIGRNEFSFRWREKIERNMPQRTYFFAEPDMLLYEPRARRIGESKLSSFRAGRKFVCFKSAAGSQRKYAKTILDEVSLSFPKAK